MQRRVRNFVADYNRRHQVTVILTSHYMADVVALCSRVILIHHGRLLYDGQLDKLAQDLAPYKQVRITLGGDQASGADCLDLPKGTDLISCDGGHVALRVARAETAAVTAHMLRTWQVVDLTVEEPPMEEVIDRVYQEGQR